VCKWSFSPLLALLSGVALAGPAEIEVTPEQLSALGIELVEVREVREAPVAALPAVCRLPGDSTVAIVVPVASTVVRVLARDGETVTKGQPVLQLSSRDFLEVQAERRTADAQVRTLAAQVERDRALVAEGIAPARRLQEGESELRAAQARAASTGALLSSVKPATDAPGEYLLLASAAGELVGAGLMPGDRVDSDTAAFFITDSAKIWLEAQLPERLIDQVAVGYRAEAGNPARAGRIISVGRSIDPRTRSTVLAAELPAGPGLRSGQSTELTVFAPVATGTVMVPASAVTRLAGADTVFRATQRGFVAVPVQAGLRSAEGVAVRGEGLAGARVAASGISALKAIVQGN
jgi:cobalt-zinc-cadmium efflux system membrane fusion protein